MITRGLEAASHGMQALIIQEDAIANNVANVNTTGFKRTNMAFKNILDAQVAQRAPSATQKARVAGELSLGSAVDRTYIDFSQGVLNQTGSKLDIGIGGEGFFKIRLADTVNKAESEDNYYYTRNGNFHLNTDNYLVTSQGNFVVDEMDRRIRLVRNPEDPTMDENNRIDFEKELLVSEDGLIQLVESDGNIPMQRIQIVDFQDKTKISYLGDGKFIPAKGFENEAGRVRLNEGFALQQGMLEGANTNTVREMIQSINVSRSYETLSKIVKTTGDTVSQAIELGKIKG